MQWQILEVIQRGGPIFKQIYDFAIKGQTIFNLNIYILQNSV